MPGGRPTALTPTMVKNIADTILREECKYITAATALRVPKATAHLWMQKGRAASERRAAGMTPAERRENGLPSAADDKRFLELLDAVEEATALAVIKGLRELKVHAQGDRGLPATVKRLGWLDPEYRDVQRTEVTGKDGGPVKQESTVTATGLVALQAQMMPVPLAPPVAVPVEDEQDVLTEDEQDDLL